MALVDRTLGGGVLTHMADATSTMPSMASIAARAIVVRNPFFIAYFLWPIGRTFPCYLRFTWQASASNGWVNQGTGDNCLFRPWHVSMLVQMLPLRRADVCGRKNPRKIIRMGWAEQYPRCDGSAAETSGARPSAAI